jgi:hypothetical protein
MRDFLLWSFLPETTNLYLCQSKISWICVFEEHYMQKVDF